MLSQIAIPAEQLKVILGPSEPPQFSVERFASVSRIAHEFSSMLTTAPINMIKRKKLPIGLSTAHATAAVGGDHFLSKMLITGNLACAHFAFAATAMNTLIIRAKTLATLWAKTTAALFHVVVLVPCRLSFCAHNAAGSLPIWRKLISTDHTETISPALFIPLSLAFGVLGHILVPPLNIVSYRGPNHKRRRANNE